MKKYLSKTPTLLTKLWYNRVWHFSRKEKSIYLTFDDGPTSEITDWVLKELKKYNAKATFFCLGKNAENNPKLFHKILDQNHAIGNHTFNHLNGFKTESNLYNLDTELAEKPLKLNIAKQKLFRPPYGKMTSKQAGLLRKKGYKIVMWDVLSGDFDKNLDAETCLHNVIKNVKNGSIIVFHDSIKASEKLKFVLPQVLDYFSFKGYNFKSIS